MRRAESRVVIFAFWISVLCDVAVMEGVRNPKKILEVKSEEEEEEAMSDGVRRRVEIGRGS